MTDSFSRMVEITDSCAEHLMQIRHSELYDNMPSLDNLGSVIESLCRLLGLVSLQRLHLCSTRQWLHRYTQVCRDVTLPCLHVFKCDRAVGGRSYNLTCTAGLAHKWGSCDVSIPRLLLCPQQRTDSSLLSEHLLTQIDRAFLIKSKLFSHTTAGSVGKSNAECDTRAAYRVFVHPLLIITVTQSGPCLRPSQPSLNFARPSMGHSTDRHELCSSAIDDRVCIWVCLQRCSPSVDTMPMRDYGDSVSCTGFRKLSLLPPFIPVHGPS
jgi:hypothetical protein